MNSEMRAPAMARDRMSRPSWSVPNPFVAEGGWKVSDSEIATGSKGATQGANSAATSTSPNTAQARASWMRASRRRLRAGVLPANVGSAGVSVSTMGLNCKGWGSAIVNARVDDGIEQVHREVDQREHGG